MLPAKRSGSSVEAETTSKRSRRSATPEIKQEVKEEEIGGEEETPNPLEDIIRQKDAEIADLKTQVSQIPSEIDAATGPLKETIRNKSDEVSGLEARIFELQEFILSESLITKATPSIKQHLKHHPNAANILERCIRGSVEDIHHKYRKPENELEYESADEEARFQRLNDELLQYIPDIEWLSHIPDGLSRAYQTIQFLSHHSFYAKGTEWFEPRSRDLDRLADDLLVDLLHRLRLEDGEFVPGPEYNELLGDVALFETSYSYFPKSHGLMFSWVRGEGSAFKLRTELKDMIAKINTECEDKIQRILHDNQKLPLTKRRPTQIESELSKILEKLERDMTQFVRVIRLLGHMDGGLELAFHLILFLGRQSYTEMSPTQKYSRNYTISLHGPADQLLVEVAHRIKERNKAFMPMEEVERLAGEIEYLAGFDIKTYFPASFRLLSTWVPSFATAYAKEAQDQIKAKIDKAHAVVAKRLAQYKYDKKRPTSDWLSNAMVEFVPEIAHFSEKPGSLMLAIDLLFYLSKQSYTNLEDWQQILDPTKGLPADKYLEPEDETLAGTNFGPRPSDGPVDKLLIELVSRAKEER